MGIRRNRLLSAGLSAVIVVLAMSGAGIQASASTIPGPDFSTPQGIDTYLQSRGIDPGTAIWQTGLDNYVGDSCPGAGWHCIAPTHTPVVQIAPAGGDNEFTCAPATGSGSCFVLQISAGGAGDPPNATNNFNCVQNSNDNPAVLDAATGCGWMTQVNTTGKNRAMIKQRVRQRSAGASSPCPASFSQCATETAGSVSAPLSQMNGSGNNEITIEQTSLQDSSDTSAAAQTTYVSQVNGTGQNQASVDQQEQQQVSDAASTQDQEGTQVACVTQDSPNGQNQASVNQLMSQNEQSSAATLSQVQNQTPGPQSTCGTGTAATSVSPNLAALVLQTQDTTPPAAGNQQTVKQSLDQQEQSSTGSGSVTQQQGPFSDQGGLEAIPDQTSSGLSTLNISQNEQQNMTASTTGFLRQSQQDPIRQPDCSPPDCSQGNNPNDTFTLTQTGVQQAGPTAGQSVDIEGHCTTSGTCTIQSTSTSSNLNGGAPQTQSNSCNASLLEEPSCTTSTSIFGTNEGG